MAEKFDVGKPVSTADPKVEVAIDPANPLKPGKYRFRLTVIDSDGVESPESFAIITIKKATAVTLVGPAQPIRPGQNFVLTATVDMDPGTKIKAFNWTLVGVEG